jgi:hypothetical protein
LLLLALGIHFSLTCPVNSERKCGHIGNYYDLIEALVLRKLKAKVPGAAEVWEQIKTMFHMKLRPRTSLSAAASRRCTKTTKVQQQQLLEEVAELVPDMEDMLTVGAVIASTPLGAVMEAEYVPAPRFP